MSRRGIPGDNRNQQPHAASRPHVLRADQQPEAQESTASSSSSSGPVEGYRRSHLTQHDYTDYAGSSASLRRHPGAFETVSPIERTLSARDLYGHELSLSDRRSSVVARSDPIDPLSSLSPDLDLEDDGEDDGSSDIDDEGVGNEQNWIEEDLTAAASSSSGTQPRGGKRFRLTHAQTRFLVNEFSRQQHPDAAQRERLSQEIPGLSTRQVQVWFQNRRAKIKRLYNEDQERIKRARAQQASMTKTTPSYPSSSATLHHLTMPAPYGASLPFTGLSIHDHHRETERRLYGNTAPNAPNMASAYDLESSTLQSFSTRASASQSSHSFLPTTLPPYGTTWENAYPGVGVDQNNATAYPPLATTSTLPGINMSRYTGSYPITSMGGDLSYAGVDPLTNYLSPTTSLSYQMADLHTAGPEELSRYGLDAQYPTALDPASGVQTTNQRHDSINETADPTSTSYANYPGGYTSTHMPRYHRYNG